MTAQLTSCAAEHCTLEASEQRVAALVDGAPGSPAVLLVPGYTGSKEDFAPILDPIAAAGLRAVAIDLPGQFESPDMVPADYTPDALGAVVCAIARQLGGPVRLLGHSFGGLVARAAVIADPKLFSSLVLLSSGPAQLGGSRRANIDRLEPVLATAGLPGVYAAMQAVDATQADYVAPPAELADFLQRRFLGGSVEMLQGMGDALRSEPDRVAELAATGVPVLVLHGVDDDAWDPATQREMAQRLDAEYAVIPGAAHSAAVENPDATARRLLQFWRASH